MSVPLYQVDAFAAMPFAGNPAGVCLLPAAAESGWMAAVAKETQLPATAFVYPDGNRFSLRWFTATTELELCGHGTLASAHVLYEAGHVERRQPIHFQSRGGPLTATERDGWIELDFPAMLQRGVAPPPGLAEALGVELLYVGRGKLDCLVEVADEATVRDLRPDLTRLRAVDARGIIVTSRSDNADRDFVSRFFAPSVGIAEDPVTGSAHCCLAPYWAAKLKKSELVAQQISARGGMLRLRLDGDRVCIAGQAVTVIRGELLGLC